MTLVTWGSARGAMFGCCPGGERRGTGKALACGRKVLGYIRY